MGSTALKSDTIGAEVTPPWLDTFKDFYDEFPITFKEEQKKFECKEIEFWKGIGDELLWLTTLTEGSDAISVLRSFKCAIEAYNNRLDENGKKVRLKGTAWIAGFPITHKEIRLPNGSFDYIGPYIDTGFRLSKFSSRMKMVISVDLAWLLINCRTLLSEQNDLPLRFEESECMKGVLGGKPYPIIWIECNSPLEAKEYNLLRRRDCTTDWRRDLEEFCREFIIATDDKVILPYIIDDDVFGETPHKSYYDWLKQSEQKEPLEITETNADVQMSISNQNSDAILKEEVLLPTSIGIEPAPSSKVATSD